jgi:hypothetical protein
LNLQQIALVLVRINLAIVVLAAIAIVVRLVGLGHGVFHCIVHDVFVVELLLLLLLKGRGTLRREWKMNTSNGPYGSVGEENLPESELALLVAVTYFLVPTNAS